MRGSMRAAAIVPAALLALGLGVTSVLTGPAPAAHAERGYRVCGVYNSATGGNYGTGLVVKIYKDDKNNETCSQKMDYMRRYYAQAYPGSSAQLSFVMVTCELFTSRIGADSIGDECLGTTVNKIYKYTSRYDALHPSSPGLTFWRD
ncbi:hypothetical protein [Clavibacter sp. VKM Ac-2872]|uniref:hypothetical protein n=1 Tax=Clavibacter sp. VKM Ac-2872 TaxID=2783812 RepID=UPI00188C53CD|nr:hypothetical protein [Clavibacter sp. VKM Ac-2872]MBF4625426.1 hypothetical protein [Clavibacter sp. VKM Ac-2872]